MSIQHQCRSSENCSPKEAGWYFWTNLSMLPKALRCLPFFPTWVKYKDHNCARFRASDVHLNCPFGNNSKAFIVDNNFGSRYQNGLAKCMHAPKCHHSIPKKRIRDISFSLPNERLAPLFIQWLPLIWFVSRKWCLSPTWMYDFLMTVLEFFL